MVKRSMKEAQLDELLGRILGEEELRLVAPVRSRDRLVFGTVASADQIERDYVNTDMSPKELLFPMTEPIVEFSFEGKKLEVRSVEPEVIDTVLFGVRPCDAAGLAILEKIFSWDFDDPFFLQRREKTTVVAVSCTDPAPWCFCTAVGCGPAATDGSDVLLTQVDEETFLAEANTDRGERFVERFGDLFRSDEPVDKAPAVRAAEEKLTRRANLAGIGPAMQQAFSEERWGAIGRACLGCTACSRCCPSCHCFDIVDEGDVRGGCRLKTWDACTESCFTLHASGHNPRPTQPTRYRQRLMHKFSYFPQRFGRTMCVGCGRCLLNCPVQQDIYEAATSFVEPGAKASGG